MEKSLSSVLGVVKRRSLPALAAFVSVIGGAIAYLVVAPRVYQSSSRLMLDDKSVSVSELGRDITQVSSNGPGISPLADKAELIKSQRVLDKAIDIAFPQSQGKTSEKPVTVDELKQGLRVIIVPATNILELSYRSEDPALAAKMLNAVSMAMVEDNIKTITSEATKVRQFLEKEVPLANQQLLQAEAKENQYRQKSGIVSFEEQTKSLVESIAEVEDQERTLSAQLREIKARDASLQQITEAKNLNNAYASVRSGQDEEIKTLRAKLAELERKIIETRMRYTDAHPTVISLVGERNSLRALYQQELARVSSKNQPVSSNNVAGDSLSQELTSKLILNQIEGTAVSDKLKLLQDKKENLQTRLAQLPIKQQDLIVLTRKREEAATTLKFLQTKLEEARIAEAQKVSNIRVIEEAKPALLPSDPKPKVVLALATVFGTLLATSIVILLEIMDNTLRDASEAEDLLKLPLLGVLPRLPSKTLVLEPANRFLDNPGLVEPYRMLLKTLEFRNSDRIRVIVVSSSISGEGKSVVASHLAATAALLSWRTLIIDADLRRPVQHTLFNLAAKPGVTDVLEGNVSLLDAVQPTDIENLDVLTCGDLHGRPSQLLESTAMKSLVAEAAGNYDLVIIDTPPVCAAADAATLARDSDGLMLVTRPSITLKEMLSKSVAELTRSRIPVMGVVVNGMTSMTDKYYRYPVNGYQPRRHLASVGKTARNSLNGSRSR
ncbi:MAG: polysaccharide biosynthesis tyrosine autokinase [Scytonema sp. PMC 1069.18]|nr:polysaccharide biosynthesis tyrosine autokinase [Scytonema sp. PMC 1069.18]MEC4885594.1 polysaccharide biosynthesis tyrosine autokinase [Scytonema sp. PMC 1070.18]